MRVITTFLAGGACALLLAVSVPAATNSSENSNKQANTAQQRFEWPAETISGTISMVNPNLNLVVIKTADGVPFDMVVTPRTKIESGNQRVTLNDLSSDLNHNVSVRFRPEGRGDIARTIQING